MSETKSGIKSPAAPDFALLNPGTGSALSIPKRPANDPRVALIPAVPGNGSWFQNASGARSARRLLYAAPCASLHTTNACKEYEIKQNVIGAIGGGARRYIVTLFLVAISSVGAYAQQRISNFNQNTVFKSMQCELGLFAAKAQKQGISPALKAHIKYTTSGSSEAKASAEAGFGTLLGKILQGPKISAGYDFVKVDSNTIEGKLNLNQGNIGACMGRHKNIPAIPMNINDCLTGGIPVIKGGLTTSCSRKVTAKATFDASGKFVFWVVSVPSVMYEIDVDAPASEDKKN